MKKNRPLIIGHRGAMAYAPENTKASFETAWRMGADALECDVHLSRDGRLVVMHDETLDRTSNGKGFISKTPWAKIRRLDVGRWYDARFKGERVLSLEDLLVWLDGKKTKEGSPLKLFVEIKNKKNRNTPIAEKVVSAIVKKKWVHRTAVISFDHPLVQKVKRLAPDVFTGLLFAKRPSDLPKRIQRTRAVAIFPQHQLLTPSLLRWANQNRLFVGTYTVNELKDLKRCIRLGLHGVATNVPDRLKSLLEGGRN